MRKPTTVPRRTGEPSALTAGSTVMAGRVERMTRSALVVSTPQDVALIDAHKAIDMFQKVRIPVLGLIENMSTHICSKCGHEEHVFGHGGVAAEAEKLGVPLLAEIPLAIDIRTAADGGAPIVVSKPQAPQAQAFRDLARQLIASGSA